jgi:hypothetical protein
MQEVSGSIPLGSTNSSAQIRRRSIAKGMTLSASSSRCDELA